MNHADHVQLIQSGVEKKGGIWADLGSGTGAFTLALRDVAGPEVTIYSVDTDADSLERQKRAMDQMFPGTHITYIVDDLQNDLSVPKLDGIIMANSLHFVEDKIPVLHLWKNILKSTGRLIMVEYNTDTGNQWVPSPFSFSSFHKLAREAGYGDTQLLATIPSAFLGEIYSAIAKKQ